MGLKDFLSKLRPSAAPASPAGGLPVQTSTEQVPDLIGVESPVRDRSDDLLDRFSVARSLHRSISTAPPGWSTRIALYGAWGAGKTSVLRMLAALEREGGNVIVEFSAWSASGEAGILSRFYEALVAQLKADGIDIEPLKNWGKRMSGKVAKRLEGAGGSLAQGAAHADNEIGQIASAIGMGAAVGALAISDWVQLDAEDLRRLQKALSGRRVVVLIDDIDRADTRAVPKTLLALRELLAWPDFAFVLAFDKRMVASAIAEYSKAYGDSAELFLEKIVDVPFHLPEPTTEQAMRLSKRALDQCCPFMEDSQRFELARWFPSNPRSAKTAARKLGVLSDVARRHDAHEVDWLAVGLQELLREANPRLATAVEEAELGVSGNAFKEFFVEAVGKDEMNSLEQLIDANLQQIASLKERQKHTGLAKAVVSARLTAPKSKIDYEMALLYREPSFTSKEVSDLHDRWVAGEASLAPINLAHELAEAAKRAGGPPLEAAEELLRLAVDRYGRAIIAANNALVLYEHGSRLEDARERLSFLEYLCDSNVPMPLQCATQPLAFGEMLYRMFLDCCHRRDTAADCALRDRELAVMRRIAAACAEPARFYLDTEPFRDMVSHLPGPTGAARNAYAAAVQSALAEHAVEETLGWFLQVEGVRSAIKGVLHDAAAWLLGSPKSPIYNQNTGLPRLLLQLQRARALELDSHLAVAMKNVQLFLHLILGEVRDCNYMGTGDVVAFAPILNQVATGSWQVLIAMEAHPVAAIGLAQLRARLVAHGVPENLLPVPEWLNSEVAIAANGTG